MMIDSPHVTPASVDGAIVFQVWYAGRIVWSAKEDPELLIDIAQVRQ